MKYVAFDIEIAKEVPNGEDLHDYRPLGITCAATVTESGNLRVWHDNYAPQMSPEYIMQLIHYLWLQHEDHGRFPLTWNGMGFDFPVLAEESHDPDSVNACKHLAINHIDPGFQMVCQRGFMVGLNTAAKGMFLSGKTEGMHGGLAPTMWKGSREDQDKVLEYVTQDTKTTAELYEAILEHGELRWTSKAKRAAIWWPKFEDDKTRLLTAAEAMELPDVSVRPGSTFEPWDRNRFYGWVED